MNYISSNKFSDVSVAIRTQLPLERSTITAYNILVYMLKTKTELFKTKQALISSPKFSVIERDILKLALDDDKEYTIAEVQKAIDKFKEGF